MHTLCLARAEPFPQAVPADITAPLNVKKARRRGLVSGVHLVLPPSPLPLTSSNLAVPTPRTSSTPGTALTFTAEWDLTQKTFVFTPFESDTPSSAGTPMFILSPVPVNVDHADDDSLPRSPAPSTPSLYAPSRSSMQVLISPAPARVRRSWTEGLVVVTDAPAESRPSRLHDSSPASEPSTPVSPIFDSPPPPPKHAHARSASQSTAASSVTDLALPEAEQPPPASPKPTPADAARHTFAQELLRAVPAARDGGDFSPDTYRELDADLLLSPMDVFERTLWEGTVPDSRRATLQRPLAPPRRPPADVPRTASSAFSVYSLDVSVLSVRVRHPELTISSPAVEFPARRRVAIVERVATPTDLKGIIFYTALPAMTCISRYGLTFYWTLCYHH